MTAILLTLWLIWSIFLPIKHAQIQRFFLICNAAFDICRDSKRHQYHAEAILFKPCQGQVSVFA